MPALDRGGVRAGRGTIPAAGHASNLHQLAAFDRAVAAFLASPPAASA